VIKRRLAIAAVLCALLLALVYFNRSGHTPQGQPPLKSLRAGNLPELTVAFNAAGGQTRVLLLLSPT